VVSLACGELQSCRDVSRLQIPKVFKDLVAGGTRREEVEDVFDADAEPADAWAATALIWARSDPRQFIHGLSLSPVV